MFRAHAFSPVYLIYMHLAPAFRVHRQTVYLSHCLALNFRSEREGTDLSTVPARPWSPVRAREESWSHPAVSSVFSGFASVFFGPRQVNQSGRHFRQKSDPRQKPDRKST